MNELPEDSAEFRRLVEELEALLHAVTAGSVDKRAALDAAARRYELEQQLIRLMSPQGRPVERRRNVRVPCALEVQLGAGGTAARGKVVDLSFSGARVRTTFEGALGKPHELTLLPQPGLLDQPCHGRARHVWTRGEEHGFQFIPGDVGFDRRLLLLVLAVLKSRPGPK